MLSNRARFLSQCHFSRSSGDAVILRFVGINNPYPPIPKSPLDNHPPNALLFFSEKELMTTATQQLPSNPAIDFANAVLAETDNAREIINMLHDIAQGHRENSTANDRIAASKTLLDRGLGKCPRHISPSAGTDPESAESDNHVNHSSDTSRSEPDSPRLVTQARRRPERLPRPRSQRRGTTHRSHPSFPRKACPRAPTRGRESTQRLATRKSRLFRPSLYTFLYTTAHSRYHQQLSDANDRPDRHLPHPG